MSWGRAYPGVVAAPAAQQRPENGALPELMFFTEHNTHGLNARFEHYDRRVWVAHIGWLIDANGIDRNHRVTFTTDGVVPIVIAGDTLALCRQVAQRFATVPEPVYQQLVMAAEPTRNHPRIDDRVQVTVNTLGETTHRSRDAIMQGTHIRLLPTAEELQQLVRETILSAVAFGRGTQIINVGTPIEETIIYSPTAAPRATVSRAETSNFLRQVAAADRLLVPELDGRLVEERPGNIRFHDSVMRTLSAEELAVWQQTLREGVAQPNRNGDIFMVDSMTGASSTWRTPESQELMARRYRRNRWSGRQDQLDTAARARAAMSPQIQVTPARVSEADFNHVEMQVAGTQTGRISSTRPSLSSGSPRPSVEPLLDRARAARGKPPAPPEPTVKEREARVIDL